MRFRPDFCVALGVFSPQAPHHLQRRSNEKLLCRRIGGMLEQACERLLGAPDFLAERIQCGLEILRIGNNGDCHLTHIKRQGLRPIAAWRKRASISVA